MYNKMETIAGRLREASLHYKHNVSNYTLEEMCAKYKLTRKQFKEKLVTYDYKGHFLPLWELEKEVKPIDSLSISIKITDSKMPSPLKPKSRHRPIAKKSNNPASHPVNLAVPTIKPTYGVTFNTGDTVLDGSDYENNPILKNTQISLKQYYALCGAKGAEKSAASFESVTCRATGETKQELSACAEQERTLGGDKEALRRTMHKYYGKKWKESQKRGDMVQTYYGFSTVDSGSGTRRNATITPHKSRTDTRLKTFRLRRFRTCSTAARNYRKLAPPPVGLTVGHGILTA
eukprot:TRINITY_DN775_c0_g1_i5.p1 TRINITY_DN775_c0_g1~~TRINITY_DN775_c0_g1_i5.p1  ORF type:complete len:290 (+),score=36.21 TRINITY_DN775_c0_g1_i5:499-1368(+)